MIKLRPYQKECYDTIEKHFKKEDRQLIQIPTGGGKTTIFLSYLADKNEKSLVIVPTVDLLYQVYESALGHYNKSDIYLFRKGRPKIGNQKLFIIVAPGFLKNKVRNELFSLELKYIVIDECHRAMCKTYLDFIQEYPTPVKLLGVTATPIRLDGKDLLTLFKKITYKKTIFDLINLGFICDVKAFRIKTKHKLNSDITRHGDFRLSELKKLDVDSRNNLIVKTYEDNCKGKKTLIFCLSVEHSVNLKNALIQKGYKAGNIHGKMNKHERMHTLKQFKSGDIQVLTNCQLLCEGFDEPSIEALIIAKPTKSQALYIQMVGRGLRIWPNKEHCELYELTDNAHKICSFPAILFDDPYIDYDYKKGTSLRQLEKDKELITLSNFDLEKEEIHLKLNENNFLEVETLVTKEQIKILKRKKILFFEPLSFKDAAFMLWFDKLKKEMK